MCPSYKVIDKKDIFFIIDLRQSTVSMSPSHRGQYTRIEIFQLFLYAFVMLVGTVGNGLVIQKFFIDRDQPGSRFALALGMIDLITSIWLPMGKIGQIVNKISGRVFSFPFGKVACYLRSFDASLFASSAWLLVAISLERIR